MSLLAKAGSGWEDQCFSTITAPPIGIIGKRVLNIDRYVQLTNRPTAHISQSHISFTSLYMLVLLVLSLGREQQIVTAYL